MGRPGTLRAVFLDAGNTIVALDYEALAARIRAGGHPGATPGAVRAAEERARVRLDPHLRARRSTESQDVFVLYMRYVLEGLGIDWPEDGGALVRDLRALNPPFGPWSRLVPEAPAALEALRARGLRLAVVSNSNGTVADILRAVGLAGHLDVVVDSGVVGVEKPDPAIFRHAAGALGVRPEEAVHVGDLYSVDVLGARAAGCRAILLDPASAWPAPDCPTAPDIAAAAALILGPGVRA